MAKLQQRATIFSNGIADFRRVYTIEAGGPLEISLPVRQDHVGDVLASLNVFGAVRLKSPPSFRPANENSGDLSINPKETLTGMCTELSGSQVTVEHAGEVTSGLLVGLHTEPEGGAGQKIDLQFLVLLTSGGLIKLPFREIRQLQFDDDDVRTEIDKALKRNFQQIKPASTFVSLELVANESAESTEAVLQYTLPAAAWKMTYRLHGEFNAETTTDPAAETTRCRFQALAVVDNNTDEDWQDFTISVVTGEPMTFSTDLAESKTPGRKHVNVVKDQAFGSVELERGVMMAAAPASGMRVSVDDADDDIVVDSCDTALFEFGDKQLRQGGAGFSRKELAEVDTADVKTVGDFAVYESPQPVSIAARRSAIIPMIQTTLDQAESLLHYHEDNHPTSPFRTIRFTNETGHNLPRGVCTVFEDDVYAGSCILPATIDGEDALLPHAVETGVRVRCDRHEAQTELLGLSIMEGVWETTRSSRQSCDYHIVNVKPTRFTLLIDAPLMLSESTASGRLIRHGTLAGDLQPTESLANGRRWTVTIEPNAEITLTIEETRLWSQSVQLISANPRDLRKVDSLLQLALVRSGELDGDGALNRCLEIRGQISQAITDTQRTQEVISQLSKRQDRLRKNLSAGGQSQLQQKWQQDLGAVEDRLTTIEDETLPNLNQQLDDLHRELQSALKQLAVEWHGKTP